VAAAWGVESLPARPGRDGNAIVAALAKGDLGGVVVGGVDPDDTADPALFRAALDAAGFVVSLELRETDVTRVADVVLPVAPVTDKAGTFVTWDGRPRSFDAVFTNPSSLPDLRVLAGIADELAAVGHGRPLGFRTVAEVRAEMQALGPWDGARPALDAGKAPKSAKAPKGPKKGEVALALATWKQLVDLGSMQDGEVHLRATARTPVARVSRATYESAFGMLEARTAGEQLVTITGDRGTVTLPVVVADLPDGVVWVPARSFGRGVLADLASPGSTVTLKGAS
jgi:NADH-quinone oxidoreductase subunit G